MDEIWVDREVELAGGRMAWREAGHGPPLMFLHGLGGTRESWNPQLRRFAPSHRCIAWDMPGYGRTDGPMPLRFADIAARLVELFNHLGIDRADVVGLSFGGMHALHLAIAHPERCRRLVLADTSPAFGLDGTSPDAWRTARLAPLAEGVTPAEMAGPVLDAVAGTPLDRSVRAELVAAFARIGADGLRAAVDCLPHHDVRRELGSITAPSLVVVGERDTETPVPYARALADGLPDATLVILPDVGHLTPSENPTLFNDTVESFLTGSVRRLEQP